MITLRALACLTFAALASCTIPEGDLIGSSRVIISRGPSGSQILTAPSCPDWHRDSREDFSNRVGSNFGCADAVNFLGQLATPSDALVGRATGNEDGGAAAGSVERYRTRKTVPLTTDHETSGAGASSAGGPS